LKQQRKGLLLVDIWQDLLIVFPLKIEDGMRWQWNGFGESQS